LALRHAFAEYALSAGCFSLNEATIARIAGPFSDHASQDVVPAGPLAGFSAGFLEGFFKFFFEVFLA
jgi:hypothetical protein